MALSGEWVVYNIVHHGPFLKIFSNRKNIVFLIKNLFGGGGVGIAKIGLDIPNKFSSLLLFWPMIHVWCKLGKSS